MWTRLCNHTYITYVHTQRRQDAAVLWCNHQNQTAIIYIHNRQPPAAGAPTTRLLRSALDEAPLNGLRPRYLPRGSLVVSPIRFACMWPCAASASQVSSIAPSCTQVGCGPACFYPARTVEHPPKIIRSPAAPPASATLPGRHSFAGHALTVAQTCRRHIPMHA